MARPGRCGPAIQAWPATVRESLVHGRRGCRRYAPAGAGTGSHSTDVRAARTESVTTRDAARANVDGTSLDDGRGADCGAWCREGRACLRSDDAGRTAWRVSRAAAVPDVAVTRIRARCAVVGGNWDLRADSVFGRTADTRDRYSHGGGRTTRRYSATDSSRGAHA